MGIKDALKSFFQRSEFKPTPFSEIKYGDEGWLTVYEVFHHYNTMGYQKLMEDKYEEALDLFEKGAKLGNKRSKANILLALIGLQRKEEVEEKLKLLVEDDEVPRHSIWAVYYSMIYEFCEKNFLTIYEEMLYDYKDNPWTSERENEYRRLVDESVRLYTEAIKFEFNESTESFYKGSIYRQKCADEKMKQVREIAEQWQKHQKEPIFEGRQLEIQTEWEESRNQQYLSNYEEYWKFQKEHLGNARYKNEYYR